MSRRTCRKGRQHQCHMQGWGCKNLELLFSCRQRHVTPPACWACCDAPSSPQSPHLRHTAPTPRETAPLFSKPATGRQRGVCVPRCSTPSHNMPKHTSPSRAPPIAQPPPPPLPPHLQALGHITAGAGWLVPLQVGGGWPLCCDQGEPVLDVVGVRVAPDAQQHLWHITRCSTAQQYSAGQVMH